MLKQYPQYRTLSPQYYNEKQTFYNAYCNEPISKKEFISYVKKNLPQFIVLFGTKNVDIHQEYVIFWFKKSDYNLTYWIDRTDIIVDGDDEQFVYMDHSFMHGSYNDSSIYIIIDQLHKEYDITYDLVTMQNILSYRPCEMIKPGYTINYLKNHFQVIDYTDISTLEGLYDNITNLLYLRANANQIIYTTDNIYLHSFNYFNLNYDKNGNLINKDNENDVWYNSEMIPLYNKSVKTILGYLNLKL